jgi:hypothetical protein
MTSCCRAIAAKAFVVVLVETALGSMFCDYTPVGRSPCGHSLPDLTKRLEPPRRKVQAAPRRTVGASPGVHLQPSFDIDVGAFDELLRQVLGVIAESAHTYPLSLPSAALLSWTRTLTFTSGVPFWVHFSSAWSGHAPEPAGCLARGGRGRCARAATESNGPRCCGHLGVRLSACRRRAHARL